jgi:signal transduction histidine kinase
MPIALPNSGSSPPSRTTSRLLCAGLVVAWDALRLVLFSEFLPPLTDALPLMVCVWTRDRGALLGMTVAFAVLDAVDIFWVLPAGTLSPTAMWLAYAASLVNLFVAAAVVNLIIGLRRAYEVSLRQAQWATEQVQAQAQELRAQSEALARHNDELEQLAEILRTSDRHKSEFLATLSHELRNPLAAIRYALDLGELSDTAGEHARAVIGRQLRHLTRLVDDLLDITRIGSNKFQLRFERVELAAVIQQAVESASPEIQHAQHTLTVELPSEPIHLEADPDRLAQVVTNLLSNAARYTPKGGHITVSGRSDEGMVVISVSDDGIGLHPEDLERVFELFAQLGKPGRGGLGIGLALVKMIVEMHGGHVTASSEGVGQGCRFEVRLPLVATAAASHERLEA